MIHTQIFAFIAICVWCKSGTAFLSPREESITKALMGKLGTRHLILVEEFEPNVGDLRRLQDFLPFGMSYSRISLRQLFMYFIKILEPNANTLVVFKGQSISRLISFTEGSLEKEENDDELLANYTSFEVGFLNCETVKRLN